MSYSTAFKNEVSRSSSFVIEPISGVVGLMLVLLACGSLHAQTGPMDSPPLGGQSSPEQYKRGETPTGQKYGIIKEGEPHKSEAAKKPDRSNEKQEKKKPGPGSSIERDPRETSEGSGPDPLGR